MKTRTRITDVARQRGFTAAETARRLGLYPSNVSAMDAGRRSVSLRTLSRIAQLLGCGLGDLLESTTDVDRSPYRNRRLAQRLAERDHGAPDGSEKGWAHVALLAWQRHVGFRQARPT